MERVKLEAKALFVKGWRIKGKTVKDCFQDWKGRVVIEFNDGTKIEIAHQETNVKGHEISVPIIII
jgi:hypothetical protein